MLDEQGVHGGFPSLGRRYRSCVGFNPFREQVKHRSDIVLVAAAFVVVIVLVAWGLFG